MRALVTGATGFIGSAIVKELIGAGHQVVGLARSDASAQSLIAAGARVRRGSLKISRVCAVERLRREGAVYTAYFHEFTHASYTTRLCVSSAGLPAPSFRVLLRRRDGSFAGLHRPKSATRVPALSIRFDRIAKKLVVRRRQKVALMRPSTAQPRTSFTNSRIARPIWCGESS